MKLREIILCGLFIALVAVGAFVRIPVGTDVYTLQFLFTLLAGLMLGARLGALAIGTYVLMGLVGIPVFADVRLSRRIHCAGLGDGRVRPHGGTDISSRTYRVPSGHGGGLCLRNLVFLLCVELHHRRADWVLGRDLVLRRAAGFAGLPALRGGGVHRRTDTAGRAVAVMGG